MTDSPAIPEALEALGYTSINDYNEHQAWRTRTALYAAACERCFAAGTVLPDYAQYQAMTELIREQGRMVLVMAKFTGDRRVDDANAYMRENPEASVIAERDGTAYLAWKFDLGFKAF